VKIYTKIVIDVHTGAVKSSEWTEYSGPICLCKGGGGGTEVDKKYNAGMLAISNAQQDMANEMWNLFKFGVTYDPEKKIVSDKWKAWKEDKDAAKKSAKSGWTGAYDKDKWDDKEPDKYEGTVGEREGYDADAVMSEMELIQAQINAEGELLPMQTELAKEQLQTQTDRQGLVRSIYEDALAGVDVEGRVGEHRAGVQHAFAQEQGIATRNMARMGIDPSSGRGAASFENIGLEKAKATAGGEMEIRTNAEDENFARKAKAAGLQA
jgi:hypothetical protein